jgi:DNA-binding GntR family transcriptional regulator
LKISPEVDLAAERSETGGTHRSLEDCQGRGQSKADRVYHHLRRLIREVKLAPGTHIQKDKVAAELGVSLAPVSQALARLAEDMLVEIRPRHGSFVAPIRAHDLRECMFLRRALEVEAIRFLATSGDEELKRNLELNFEQQLQALEENNLYLLYDLDAEFHSILMHATHFPRVTGITVAARVAVDRPRQFARVMNDRAEATVNEHRRIIDAISLGDPDFAAAAMLSHLKLASDSLESALAQIEGVGVIVP